MEGKNRVKIHHSWHWWFSSFGTEPQHQRVVSFFCIPLFLFLLFYMVANKCIRLTHHNMVVKFLYFVYNMITSKFKCCNPWWGFITLKVIHWSGSESGDYFSIQQAVRAWHISSIRLVHSFLWTLQKQTIDKRQVTNISFFIHLLSGMRLALASIHKNDVLGKIF